MKAADFDDALIAEHRAHIAAETAADAYDVLVGAAVASRQFECAPAWHGEIREFRYDDRATKERPFAFIVNRKDLLFYVRKAGQLFVPGGLADLRKRHSEVKENPSGEWTIRVRDPDEARRVNTLLAGMQKIALTNAQTAWSKAEVDAVVADYFHMLTQELAGQQYNKTAHRRVLLEKLPERSEGSIELKHQNISAILLELGAPWIVGYKPRSNYQLLLRDVIVIWLANDKELDEAAVQAVEQPAIAPLSDNFANVLVAAPKVGRIAEPSPFVPRESGIKRDYLALEAKNRSLGAAGEQFVVNFEHFRLRSVGANKLADRIERVSETRGDGLGYDVLSYDADGREKLIEVKTTAFGQEAPFYVTRTELQLSQTKPEKFRLYRLFEFKREPRMFELSGAIDSCCHLDPVNYLARFR